MKSRLSGKDPDAGKDLRQKQKRVAGDEMIRASLTQWKGIGQTLGDTGGQRNLVCCGPWSGKESDMT